MPLLFEIQFGSFLVYSPRGTSGISAQSRILRTAVKENKSLLFGNPPKALPAIPHWVELMRSRIGGTALESFFSKQPVIVPAPRSSPVKPESLYPTKVICQNLVMNGLGSQMQTLLERTIQVPKAAFAKAEDRPTVAQHFASLKVSKELVHSTEILVVDDIVTSGSMLLASVSRLQEAYPDLRIKAFALIRTMSGEEITEIINICAGSIRSRGERAVRNP